jgi:hypothetical protein
MLHLQTEYEKAIKHFYKEIVPAVGAKGQIIVTGTIKGKQ